MVENIVPVDTPSNPGMGSKVKTIYFSESSHVTYQIKGNRAPRKNISNPWPLGSGQKVKTFFSESCYVTYQIKGN